MSQWRVALSLQTFIHQCNMAWPRRSKASDGTIGDARHQHEQSDHNPNAAGVVTAFDLTQDPKNGPDCLTVAGELRASKDKRIKYVIWDRRIFSSYDVPGHLAWTWRPYSGSDPHTNHLHLSVSAEPRLYDDVNPWQLPCFGLGDDDMATVMVPLPDNYPYKDHKPGDLVPLPEYLQIVGHQVFAIREQTQTILTNKKDD